DYYDATPSVAADSAGHVVVAYTFSTLAGGPKSLYVATSSTGATWTTPVLVNPRGDSNFPQLAAGPAAGDFRLAWQDNRTGAFNTWYTASANGGAAGPARGSPPTPPPARPTKNPPGPDSPTATTSPP